jgi:hypothetical protein
VNVEHLFDTLQDDLAERRFYACGFGVDAGGSDPLTSSASMTRTFPAPPFLIIFGSSPAGQAEQATAPGEGPKQAPLGVGSGRQNDSTPVDHSRSELSFVSPHQQG